MGWKKNKMGENHQNEVGKTWNEEEKYRDEGKNIGMGWKNLKIRQKSKKNQGKKSRDGAEKQRDEQENS